MEVLFIVFGIIGGLLGGMGMGGGTLLIPLLTLGLDVPQQTAQLLNLLTFIPMSAFALIVHAKNGYVVKKRIFFVILPALAFPAICTFSLSPFCTHPASFLYCFLIEILSNFH